MLPTYSDTTTSNTELGSPTILDVSLTESGSGFIALIKFDLAPAVKDLEIVDTIADIKPEYQLEELGEIFCVDSKKRNRI